MLFPYFVYIVHFTKLTHGSSLFVLVKQEKKKQAQRRKKEYHSVKKRKKKFLCESD